MFNFSSWFYSVYHPSAIEFVKTSNISNQISLWFILALFQCANMAVTGRSGQPSDSRVRPVLHVATGHQLLRPPPHEPGDELRLQSLLPIIEWHDQWSDTTFHVSPCPDRAQINIKGSLARVTAICLLAPRLGQENSTWNVRSNGQWSLPGCKRGWVLKVILHFSLGRSTHCV